MTNLERRLASIEKMVGFLVEVRKLGEGRPEDDPKVEVYVPLPEYGVALWMRVLEPRKCTKRVGGEVCGGEFAPGLVMVNRHPRDANGACAASTDVSFERGNKCVRCGATTV
jgi:hypothetical protein